MFSKKESKEATNKVAERNTIGKTTTITGEIISDGDFRIDGTLIGKLETKGRVVIGEKGTIEGQVTCENADIEGKLSGELKVNKTLTIKGSANISGEVITSKLAVESGATFNATCEMKSGVKELKKDKDAKKAKEKRA